MERIAISKGVFDTSSTFKVETKKEGNVKMAVYGYFIGQIHLMLRLLVLIMSCLTVVCNFLLRLWLTRWVNAQQLLGSSTAEFSFYASVYCALAVANTVVDSATDIFFRMVQYLIGTRLHRKLIQSLFRAPMDFFNLHPTGIILNRLSSDTSTADLGTTLSVANFITDAVQMVGSLLFISGSCLPTLVFLLPACVGYAAAQLLYVAPSRDLDRLMSKARSPTVSIFKEAMSGAPFIRAAGLQQMFENECGHRTINELRPLYMFLFIQETSAIIMDTLGVVVLFAVTFFTGRGAIKGSLPAGVAAISITYAQQICMKMMWFVRQATSIEVNMVGIERLREFSELTPELWEGVVEQAPPPRWPQAGTVRFENVTVHYKGATGEPALKNVTFALESGQHLGIIGRTGSGKSTLAKVLFRIVMPTAGRVLLDGVDTAYPPLTRLRRSMAMVAQDPTLFEGTVRENLDLLGCFSDVAIWDALRRAHAHNIVTERLRGLEGAITGSGDQLSVGEKQLLCIARAFLCKAQVVVFDEASSSVDAHIGKLIHQSISRNNDANSSTTPVTRASSTSDGISSSFLDHPTVLIIAHRLSSINACDTILVLDSGQVRETGSPQALLQSSGSVFANMMAANAL
uniref:Uncharacterized protein n=1 Tax=Pyramimonas obovata TaxID=1411642 RepID=A0A7S0QYZ9_9CHLO